jgi:hypothetical protein
MFKIAKRILQKIHQKEDDIFFPFYGNRGDFVSLDDKCFVLRRSIKSYDIGQLQSMMDSDYFARSIREDQIDKEGIIAKPIEGFDF